MAMCGLILRSFSSSTKASASSSSATPNVAPSDRSLVSAAAASRSAVPVASVACAPSTGKAVAVLHPARGRGSARRLSWPSPLRKRRASLSVVEAWVSFDCFLFLKSRSPLRPGVGRLGPTHSSPRKLFHRRPRLEQRAVDRKMLRARRAYRLQQANKAARKAWAIWVVSRRSQFLEKLEASKTASSIESPTNQRNKRSYSSRLQPTGVPRWIPKSFATSSPATDAPAESKDDRSPHRALRMSDPAPQTTRSPDPRMARKGCDRGTRASKST